MNLLEYRKRKRRLFPQLLYTFLAKLTASDILVGVENPEKHYTFKDLLYY